MGRVIAVANQKGGVGKTTTAINLAASFAAAEVNTLLIDCDPQSNATSGLGFPKDPDRVSSYHLLMGAASAEEALLTTELEQLWLIPAHKNLIGANIELVDAEGREFRLPHEMRNVRLAIGSNAASIWWLNGEEVVGIYGDRQTVIDDGVSKRVTLTKGLNTIRAAVINAGGATDFCARFLDSNDNPLRGIRVRLAPE